MKMTFEILARPEGEEYYFAICKDPCIFLYEKDIDSLMKAAEHASTLYSEIINENNKRKTKWRCEIIPAMQLQLSC